jgi:hypothetical protein
VHNTRGANDTNDTRHLYKHEMNKKWICYIILILGLFPKGFCQIPEHIQKIADSLIVNRIGTDNYPKVIIDCYKSGPFLVNSVWETCKDTTIKLKRRQQKYIDNLWLNNDIEFYWFEFDYKINDSIVYRSDFWLDTLGNFYKTHDLKLPDFKQNPEYLNRIISKERALYLADSIEFEKGIRDWQIDFAYNERTGQFCWEIKSFDEYKVYSLDIINSRGKMIKINCTTEEIETGFGWIKETVE